MNPVKLSLSLLSYSAMELRALFMSIERLLAIGSPAAISWFISPIVIYSIKRVTRWARTHMLYKCTEVIQPFSTHRYSPAAVTVIVMLLLFGTAALSVVPSPIFASYFPICAISMGKAWGLCSPKTATAFGVAALKFACWYDSDCTACASTPPSGKRRAGENQIACSTHDSQPSKYLSFEINT